MRVDYPHIVEGDARRGDEVVVNGDYDFVADGEAGLGDEQVQGEGDRALEAVFDGYDAGGHGIAGDGAAHGADGGIGEQPGQGAGARARC